MKKAICTVVALAFLGSVTPVFAADVTPAPATTQPQKHKHPVKHTHVKHHNKHPVHHVHHSKKPTTPKTAPSAS